MKDVASLTISEIEERLAAESVAQDFLDACQKDRRSGVQRAWRRFQRAKADRERVDALYTYEKEAQKEGFEWIAGVDEAGRGPLAGPVVVAAVILPIGLYLPKLNDSKKISANVREDLYERICEKALALHCAIVDAATIDRVNIYQATVSGMYEAILALYPVPQKVLIDAVELTKLPMPSLSIVKGDAKSASIAAASIIAKVTRDRLMAQYDTQYPAYGFAQNKGYGTAQHLAALRKYGACPLHRRSFEPVQEVLPPRR